MLSQKLQPRCFQYYQNVLYCSPYWIFSCFAGTAFSGKKLFQQFSIALWENVEFIALFQVTHYESFIMQKGEETWKTVHSVTLALLSTCKVSGFLCVNPATASVAAVVSFAVDCMTLKAKLRQPHAMSIYWFSCLSSTTLPLDLYKANHTTKAIRMIDSCREKKITECNQVVSTR